jgi:hypothetical protein
MSFALLLEGFFQTVDAVLKIEFRLRGQRICGTLLDADLTALTELPVPLHLVLCLIVSPT